MPREQRKYLRTELSLPADCIVLDEAGITARTHDVTVLDLSAGGARIEATEALMPGMSIRLMLKHDDPEIDTTPLARILRTAPTPDGTHIAAMEFVGLDTNDRVAITRFVLITARRSGQGATPIHDQAGSHRPSGKA